MYISWLHNNFCAIAYYNVNNPSNNICIMNDKITLGTIFGKEGHYMDDLCHPSRVTIILLQVRL